MGLERLRRLRPFRGMSANEFRVLIEAIREEARGTASGGIEGVSGPEGLLLAQQLQEPIGVAPPIHIGKVCQKAVHFGLWGREYADCQRLMTAPTDHSQTPIFETDTFTRVYMYPPGQAYTVGNFVLMFQATFPGDVGNPTAWIGIPLIQIWRWAAGQYWTEPDCGVEECGEDIPPDDDPTWPIGDCG